MGELTARNLSKSYGKKRAVENVSLTVHSGEIVGLLGPNGAGKTTSFYCIVGLSKCDSGSIELNSVDITRAPMHIRARHGLGYLPQEASVFRKLTTYANIAAIAELRRDLNRQTQQKKVAELLSEFNLDHVRDTRGERLSGGERRRLEIARALVTEPQFMLLDEPFAGVDPISIAEIKSNIQHLSERSIGVLITDHNVRETLDICDRAYIVNDGHIIAEGDPPSILANKTVRRVYLGSEFQL